MRTRIASRFAMVVIAGMFGSVVATPAVGAAPGGSLSAVASGPFAGTTSYTFVTDGCSFVHQVYDGTYGTRRKATGSFHLSGCVDLVGSSFLYTGSFSVDAKGQGALTGTVTGTVDAATLPCAPLDFVLTVTGGTGRLARVSGSITLQGSWCGRGNVPAVDDPISGQLVGSLIRH